MTLTEIAHENKVALLSYSISDKTITLRYNGKPIEYPISLKEKIEPHDIGGTSMLGIKYEYLG